MLPRTQDNRPTGAASAIVEVAAVVDIALEDDSGKLEFALVAENGNLTWLNLPTGSTPHPLGILGADVKARHLATLDGQHHNSITDRKADVVHGRQRAFQVLRANFILRAQFDSTVGRQCRGCRQAVKVPTKSKSSRTGKTADLAFHLDVPHLILLFVVWRERLVGPTVEVK